MKEISLKIPDSLEVNQMDLQMILACDLYEKGMISVGQAADMSGLSTRSFIEIVGRFNVSIVNYSPDEIEKDFHNA